MAMGIVDLLKNGLSSSGLPDTNDQSMERRPKEGGRIRDILSPDKFMQNKQEGSDPNIIYDDGGNAVDYSNPFSKLLSGNPKQGTIRNFLQRMGVGNETNVGTAIEADLSGGRATGADLSPIPSANQPQANLQPKKDYSLPNVLPPDALPQLRNSLLTGGGLDPAMYTPDGPEANTLAGRMSGPNSKAEQAQGMDEAQSIADNVRNGYNSVSTGTPKGPTI